MLTKDDEPIQDGYYWIRNAENETTMIRRRRGGYWSTLVNMALHDAPFALCCRTLGIVAIEPVKPASWLKEGDAQ